MTGKCGNPMLPSTANEYPKQCQSEATIFFEGLDGKIHYLCSSCSMTRAYRHLKGRSILVGHPVKTSF